MFFEKLYFEDFLKTLVCFAIFYYVDVDDIGKMARVCEKLSVNRISCDLIMLAATSKEGSGTARRLSIIYFMPDGMSTADEETRPLFLYEIFISRAAGRRT